MSVMPERAITRLARLRVEFADSSVAVADSSAHRDRCATPSRAHRASEEHGELQERYGPATTMNVVLAGRRLERGRRPLDPADRGPGEGRRTPSKTASTKLERKWVRAPDLPTGALARRRSPSGFAGCYVRSHGVGTSLRKELSVDTDPWRSPSPSVSRRTHHLHVRRPRASDTNDGRSPTSASGRSAGRSPRSATTRGSSSSASTLRAPEYGIRALLEQAILGMGRRISIIIGNLVTASVAVVSLTGSRSACLRPVDHVRSREQAGAARDDHLSAVDSSTHYLVGRVVSSSIPTPTIQPRTCTGSTHARPRATRRNSGPQQARAAAFRRRCTSGRMSRTRKHGPEREVRQHLRRLPAR